MYISKQKTITLRKKIYSEIYSEINQTTQKHFLAVLGKEEEEQRSIATGRIRPWSGPRPVSPSVVRWRRSPSVWSVVVPVIIAIIAASVVSAVIHTVIVTRRAPRTAWATSTICGPAHVDSRGWGVRSLCDGEVHPDPTTIQLHAIGSLLCLFGILFVLKVNKRKAPGAPRLLVIHNTDIRQGAVFREDFPQIPLCGVQAQPKHAQATVWIWIRAVADVPAAVGHGWAAMAPSPALSTVGPTVRSATIGPWAGPRSAIVSAWATVRMGPRFRPGPRPRFRVGVAGAFFWTGRRASRGVACRLPWAPWTHAPGCRVRLLNEPHTPTHVSSAPMRGQTEKLA